SPEEERLAAMFGQLLGTDGHEVLRELLAHGTDLSALAASAGMPADAATLQAMVEQVQRMLASAGDDPVNRDLADDAAGQAAAEGGDPSNGEGRAGSATKA